MVHGDVKTRPRPRRVIDDMDHERALACGVDVPSQAPPVALAIDAVGITDKTFWVPLDTGLTPFKGEILLGLPKDYRGIHMSRIEEAAERMGHNGPMGPAAYALRLVEEVLQGQPCQHIHFRMEGGMPILRVAPVTSRASLEAQWVGVEVHKVRGSGSAWIKYGIGVSHITACPCTQAYNRALFGDRIASGGEGPGFATHSQRSFTKLSIAECDVGVEDGTSVELHELLMVLEEELHVVQGLLKRPDEAELVFRAHKEPQFVEDVVRCVARRAKDELQNRLRKGASIRVETLSLESIHSHNVKAWLELTI